MEFKPFSNLTTKWVKSLMLGNLLWIIRIGTTKSGTEDSFPMQAHLVFANKIAWAVICQNIWQEGGIDVVGASLNESQVADLMAYFSTNTFDNAREAIFQEAIKVAEEEVESLIWFHSRNRNDAKWGNARFHIISRIYWVYNTSTHDSISPKKL
jgi:hypothetical protein